MMLVDRLSQARPAIVAEPGGTHGGDLDTMHRLIDMAAACGATAIKPQWTSSPARMVTRRRAPQYLEAYARLAYSLDWHDGLRAHAAEVGLDYVVSVYLPEDVPTVAARADAIKVASFEAANLPMLGAAEDAGVPIIISTGMLSAAEIACAAGFADVLLHCVSAYPAPPESLALGEIQRIGRSTGLPVGFSDHSRSVQTGAFAVAAGAVLLEVHVRLDDCDPSNPDYAVALSPAEFTEYARLARLVGRAMGDRAARVDAEAAMRAYRVAEDAA